MQKNEITGWTDDTKALFFEWIYHRWSVNKKVVGEDQLWKDAKTYMEGLGLTRTVKQLKDVLKNGKSDSLDRKNEKKKTTKEKNSLL